MTHAVIEELVNALAMAASGRGAIAVYQQVLVPLDGSPPAERALEYAKSIVKSSKGRLILVEAVHTGASIGIDAAQAQIEGIRAAQCRLNEHVAKLHDQGFEAESRVDCGHPGEVILQAVHDLAVDLVVMSTHGHSGLRRVVYGAVAEQVLRHAEVPILFIPLNCERAWPFEAPYRILLPLDGSELAEEAVQPAAALARSLGASITLLRVVQPSPPSSPYDVVLDFDAGAALSSARDYLAIVQARLAAAELSVDTLALRGHPAAIICSEAERQRATAIAMATHGRGGLARLVLGSVATSVMQACRRPILLVCPAAIIRHMGRFHSDQRSRR